MGFSFLSTFQADLNEIFFQSLCSFPYNLHNRSRCCQNDSELCNDGIVINFEKKAKRQPVAVNNDYGIQITESFAGRAEMLRYLGHHEVGDLQGLC